jgi:hypothetical protein
MSRKLFLNRIVRQQTPIGICARPNGIGASSEHTFGKAVQELLSDRRLNAVRSDEDVAVDQGPVVKLQLDVVLVFCVSDEATVEVNTSIGVDPVHESQLELGAVESHRPPYEGC